MMVCECRTCGVELTDDNWYPSFKKGNSRECKACCKERKRLWREDNREKEMNRIRTWRKENPEKNRLSAERGRRARGQKSFIENIECPSFLGVGVAEEVLCKMFADVVRMPYGHRGFDFICNKGKKIDSKSSCQLTDGSWKFYIRRNTTPDFFICLAFDDRTNLNPLYAWMLPAKEFNHLQCLSISPSTIDKLDDYRIDISKVVKCCDMMKGENNV